MGLPKSIKIRELGPREGFQTISTVHRTEDKLELIEALSSTGVRDIEITSFVRADLLPQMGDCEGVVNGFKRHPGIRYSALYLNVKGFKKAEATGRLDNQCWLYTAASNTFLRKNSNSTIQDQLKSIPEWLAAFKESKKDLHGLMISTAFGCNFEGCIEIEQTIKVLKDVILVLSTNGESLKEVCLADTMGHGTPDKVRRLVSGIKELWPELYLSLHLHDTRGTGIANFYAGLLEGVDCFDSSVGGLGGCPFAKVNAKGGAAGNICTEDIVLLCKEMGIGTGIDLSKYAEAARLAAKIVGFELPGKIYKLSSC